MDEYWPVGGKALLLVWAGCLAARVGVKESHRQKARYWSVQIEVSALLLFLIGLVLWPIHVSAGPENKRTRRLVTNPTSYSDP